MAVSTGTWVGASVQSVWDMLLPAHTKAHTHSSSWLLLGQATTANVCMFTIAPMWYWHHVEQQPLKALFPHRPVYLRLATLTIGLTMAFVLASTWIAQWNAALRLPMFLRDFEVWAQQREVSLREVLKLLTSFEDIPSLIMGLVAMAVVPAVGEELLFRGVLQNMLYQGYRRRDAAIWASAVIFSAVHGQFYAFFPRLLIGALLGYIYWWTRNLLFPIIGHFCNNATVLLLIYLHRQGVLAQDVTDATSFELPALPWFILATGIAALLAIAMHREVRVGATPSQ